VFWLTSWIRSGLITITIPDLLDLEENHPGLMRDIDTCVWQIELIKEQMKDERNGQYG
jgi:hypothetical protein